MENNVIERKVVVNEFMVSLAEDKLLEELSEPHSPDLDLIHNLLCDELPYDIDLVTGILKEGRSIGGAYQHANDLAFKQYQSMEHKVKGVNGVAVHDTQVFEWITEYFKLEFLEDSSGAPVAHMNAPTKKRKSRKKATPVVSKVTEKTEDSSSQSATSLYEIGKSLGQSSPKAVEEVPSEDVSVSVKEKDLKLKRDGQFEFDLFGGDF